MMQSPDDLAWFSDQVRREQSRLRAYIRAMGVRGEAVDDFAQDALVIAYEKRALFLRDVESDFGAWVRGIARKLIANAARKTNRRTRILCEHLSELMLELESAQLHPLHLNGEEDRINALRACLDLLPDFSRRLIRYRYFEELAPGAIAGRLERTSNHVRQLLFRIRHELLACITKRLVHSE